MTIPFVPILHVGSSYPSGWLHSDWRPEPSVILGVFLLIAGYLWLTGPKNRRADGGEIEPVTGGQRVAFVAGSLVALIALNPPLDDWSDSYLLTAHMAQHLLLIFAAAPLWLAGTPEWLLRRLAAPRVVNRIGYALTRPAPAFVVSAVVIALWHMPFAYDGALRHNGVHIVQHLSFIVAAVIGWWPVMGSLAEWPRLSPPMRCLYLFLTSIPNGLVGAFITLAAPGLYTPYTNSPRIWGISLATDQQLAGLMMWVLTSVFYLLIITVIFFRWADAEEAKERGVIASVSPADPVTSRRLDSSTPGLSS